ncbi:MAG: hypothetical protein RLZ98_2760 [Pseudomonadota bacterium]|jgi:general secretion pathway protein F
MPHYEYKAYDKVGSSVYGHIDGPTREEALAKIARLGLLPVSIHETAPASETRWWQREITLIGRQASKASLALLAGELATLISARVPLDEALRIVLAQRTLPRVMQAAVSRILDRLVAGESLSEAIESEAPVFPDYFAKLVGAGEKSGRLDAALGELAASLERSANLHARLSAALLYPLVLIIAALVTITLVVGVLLPTIAPLFAEARATPPVALSVMLSIHAWTASNWPLVAIFLAASAITFAAAWHRPAQRHMIDGLLLQVPLAGELIRLHQSGRYARVLSMLMKGGLPLHEALRISETQLSNSVFRQAARQATESISQGSRLSSALSASPGFTELTTRLVAIGEETGQLEEMLQKLAATCETILERKLERLTSMIAPALTIVVGTLIALIVYSVMSTIIGLNELAVR